MPTTHLAYRASYQDHARLYDQVFERLRAIPGIRSADAATVSVFPLTLAPGGHTAAIAPAHMPSNTTETWPFAHYGFATPGYFDAMGIPIIVGRSFRNEDTSAGAPAVIISLSLARDLFGREDAIGRQVEFAGWGWTTFTVVGVVGDVPGTTLRQGASRAIYLPHLYPPAAASITPTLFEYTPRFETLVIRSDRDPVALVGAIRRAVAEIDPRIPVLDAVTLDGIVAGATARERSIMRLILASAGAALFLGVVGIYGVLAYSVRQRGPEIAIRVALGATPRHVTQLVIGQGAALSGVGIVVGLLAALGLTRFMAAILYQTSPTDPLTFAGVTLILFAVSLAASWIPAHRASRTDPAVTLRAE
jgi:predicted permease